MCKVIVKDSSKNVEFIIYNHLFSHDFYKFTISQLVDELRQYNLELSVEFVKKEVDDFVKAGLVNQSFRCYTICDR